MTAPMQFKGKSFSILVGQAAKRGKAKLSKQA